MRCFNEHYHHPSSSPAKTHICTSVIRCSAASPQHLLPLLPACHSFPGSQKTSHTATLEEPVQCQCISISAIQWNSFLVLIQLAWFTGSNWAVQKNIQTTPTWGIPVTLKQMRNGKKGYSNSVTIWPARSLFEAHWRKKETEREGERREERGMLGVCLWALAFPSFNA